LKLTDIIIGLASGAAMYFALCYFMPLVSQFGVTVLDNRNSLNLVLCSLITAVFFFIGSQRSNTIGELYLLALPVLSALAVLVFHFIKSATSPSIVPGWHLTIIPGYYIVGAYSICLSLASLIFWLIKRRNFKHN
jgi:hypothetical protein